MDKKINNKIFKWGLGIIALILFSATSLMILNPVFAQGQETCPNGGGWIKVDGLSGTSYTYTAPEDKLIAETCYKAGTVVEYDTIIPPQKTVTVISTVGFDLSHASFRLVDEPQPSPTPTDEPTPSPTPTDEPTPSPTPTDGPTPTPTDEPTPSPTPTEELDFEPLSLTGICPEIVTSIGVFQASEETITWTVSNENDIEVAFNWSANNGQSGSGIVPANGSANFVTDIDGYAVDLDYMLGDETMEEQASIEPCEPQQETEEPTPTATEEPTEEPEVTEDPEPDQPAGGMGPSLISTIIPFALGLSGIAAVATIILKNRKETIS